MNALHCLFDLGWKWIGGGRGEVDPTSTKIDQNRQIRFPSTFCGQKFPNLFSVAKKCIFPQFSVAKKCEISRFGVILGSVWRRFGGRLGVLYRGRLGAAMGGTQGVSQVGSEGVFDLALGRCARGSQRSAVQTLPDFPLPFLANTCAGHMLAFTFIWLLVFCGLDVLRGSGWSLFLTFFTPLFFMRNRTSPL